MRMVFALLACCTWLLGSINVVQASTIHDLVGKGNLAKTKILLERDPKLLNEVDEDDYTPLHIAAMYDQADIASYLLDKGADIELLNADGFTPLQHACFLGKVKTARLIIDKTGKCDILSAVMLRDTILIKKILDTDPKLVNAPDVNGDTPLWTAVSFGYTDIAELLLDRGADANATGPQNGTPLSRSVGSGCTELVKLLLDKGADLNAPGNENLLHSTMTPSGSEIAKLLLAKGVKVDIFYATYIKDIEKVRVLLDADPVLCKAGTEGYTPLHIAAERNATEIAKLLIDKGADPNSGYPGNTPLNLAAMNGSKEVAVLLVSKGVKINVPSRMDSPLHIAVENDRNDLARFLITKGAKIDAVGDYGNTPLLIAAKRGNKELVTLLISKECAVNAKDDCGATPLGWAAAKQHKEVATLLSKHGGKKVIPPRDILENGPPAGCDPLYIRTE